MSEQGLREAVQALIDEWAADPGRTWIASCADDLRDVLAAHPQEDR